MTMTEYRYKREKKPLHIYYENNYFSRQDIADLTGLTKAQLSYLSTIGLVKPIASIHGIGSFYTYLQIVEIKAIQKFHEDFGIRKTKLKIVKDVLQEIDSSKDLSDKNILIAYGELFFINKSDLENKLISLSKEVDKHGLVKYFALADLENELDSTAKIINMSDYLHKKNTRFNVA